MVALKKQRKLTNREKLEGVKPIIAENESKPIWLDEYKDFFTLKTNTVTQAFIDKLGEDLLTYTLNNPGKLRFDMFFFEKGIAMSTAKTWKHKFPDFAVRWEEAKRMIGRRREDGSHFKNGDLHEATRCSLKQFLYEFRKDMKDTMQIKADIDVDVHERKAKIDAQNDIKSGAVNIKVEMVAAPDTGKVKPKPSKEVSDE